jgi:hypothetical protein
MKNNIGNFTDGLVNNTFIPISFLSSDLYRLVI